MVWEGKLHRWESTVADGGQRPPLIRTGQGAEKRVNQQDQALSNQGTPLMTHFLHLMVPPPPQTASPAGVYMFQHRSLWGRGTFYNQTVPTKVERDGGRQEGEVEKETAFQNFFTGGAKGCE